MDANILHEIGSELKKHRISKGLITSQISKKIKIRQKYLKAIENCDLKSLPSKYFH